MNEAKALLDAGNLGGAIEAAISAVKSKPTDIQARTFLFELSLFSGDWDRANRQLEAIGHQSVEAMIGSKIYQQCIEAERKRAKFFSESLKPEFLSTPPDYVYGLLTANNRLREGNAAEAREILDTVEEQRPAFACRINGEAKQDFRDYNDLTSSILEVIIKDSYVWVPFEEIVKIEFTKPQSLRDLFWLQATLETLNGTNGEVFIPSLYVDSWKHASDQTRLGRMTDWRDAGSELYIGEGQKIFWIDGEDRPILELAKVEFSGEEMAESA
ncbi:MAG TPA: type VI secretion system accessory protein TagJ [Pyrinomonadaceae bacterium]